MNGPALPRLPDLKHYASPSIEDLSAMDSLTHIVFGASLGGLVLGHRAGIRAYVWGAILANLPDIDALLHSDAIGYLLIHRGITHSLFFQTLAVPLLVLLILALHRDQLPHWRSWALLTWLALITHSLLDAMNPYGAQILAPFSWDAVSFNTIYVVDPLFTAPLALGLLLAWRYRSTCLRPMLAGGMSLALVYLLFAAGAKWHVQTVADQEFARQGMQVDSSMVMPMPFTTLLWRVLAMDEQGHLEGYYSLADGKNNIAFSQSDSRRDLLEPLADHLPVQQLRHFSKGFYQIEADGEDVVIRDLRLGQQSYYPVSFLVAHLQDGMVIPARDRRMPASVPVDQMGWLWQRIWKPVPVFD